MSKFNLQSYCKKLNPVMDELSAPNPQLVEFLYSSIQEQRKAFLNTCNAVKLAMRISKEALHHLELVEIFQLANQTYEVVKFLHYDLEHKKEEEKQKQALQDLKAKQEELEFSLYGRKGNFELKDTNSQSTNNNSQSSTNSNIANSPSNPNSKNNLDYQKNSSNPNSQKRSDYPNNSESLINPNNPTSPSPSFILNSTFNQENLSLEEARIKAQALAQAQELTSQSYGENCNVLPCVVEAKAQALVAEQLAAKAAKEQAPFLNMEEESELSPDQAFNLTAWITLGLKTDALYSNKLALEQESVYIKILTFHNQVADISNNYSKEVKEIQAIDLQLAQLLQQRPIQAVAKADLELKKENALKAASPAVANYFAESKASTHFSQLFSQAQESEQQAFIHSFSKNQISNSQNKKAKEASKQCKEDSSLSSSLSSSTSSLNSRKDTKLEAQQKEQESTFYLSSSSPFSSSSGKPDKKSLFILEKETLQAISLAKAKLHFCKDLFMEEDLSFLDLEGQRLFWETLAQKEVNLPNFLEKSCAKTKEVAKASYPKYRQRLANNPQFQESLLSEEDYLEEMYRFQAKKALSLYLEQVKSSLTDTILKPMKASWETQLLKAQETQKTQEVQATQATEITQARQKVEEALKIQEIQKAQETVKTLDKNIEKESEEGKQVELRREGKDAQQLKPTKLAEQTEYSEHSQEAEQAKQRKEVEQEAKDKTTRAKSSPYTLFGVEGEQQGLFSEALAQQDYKYKEDPLLEAELKAKLEALDNQKEDLEAKLQSKNSYRRRHRRKAGNNLALAIKDGKDDKKNEHREKTQTVKAQTAKAQTVKSQIAKTSKSSNASLLVQKDKASTQALLSTNDKVKTNLSRSLEREESISPNITSPSSTKVEALAQEDSCNPSSSRKRRNRRSRKSRR